MKLYGYWRSSCSWRVRIALNLKKVSWEYVPVNLLKGEQHADAYRAISPSGTVPTLEFQDGGKSVGLQQSLAIIEYLDERFPTPALLPRDPIIRARTRMLAEQINSGIQPLQNLKVLVYVESALKGNRKTFAAHWVQQGLEALEKMASATTGRFLVGDDPTVADLCLVPQLYGLRRFGVDLAQFPLLSRVEENCNALPAFASAHADKQPDATP